MADTDNQQLTRTMRRFSQLYAELDATTSTSAKVAALARYFQEAPEADAAWALHFLTGGRLRRLASAPLLRRAAAEAASLPPWLVDECHHAVGDLAEAIALLLPPVDAPEPPPLANLVAARLLPLACMDDPAKAAALADLWAQLVPTERFLCNKLLTGALRVGVARGLVLRALAQAVGVPQGLIERRFAAGFEPTPEAFLRLTAPADAGVDPAAPYPFFLASPLESPPESLGPTSAWVAEWKWDGIRAQLLRREGAISLWSRGEEYVTHRFPEIAAAAEGLPPGTVLDGELLAWRDGRPLPFVALQRRIQLDKPTPRILSQVPVSLVAYDLLEHEGADIRDLPVEERRARLALVVATAASSSHPLDTGELTLFDDDPATHLFPIRVSEPIARSDWEGLAAERARSRALGVEGVMLKRLGSPYRQGRVRGDWWKWKIDPHTIDAVMIYAQAGHGRRASLHTDYTFAVWHEGTLVPVAKAYSGLVDDEIREVDAWIRAHTTERFGPVRAVEPVLVFEIAFEALQLSTRHKSGIAVRFPRIRRWRRDKPAAEADTLDAMRSLAALAP